MQNCVKLDWPIVHFSHIYTSFFGSFVTFVHSFIQSIFYCGHRHNYSLFAGPPLNVYSYKTSKTNEAHLERFASVALDVLKQDRFLITPYFLLLMLHLSLKLHYYYYLQDLKSIYILDQELCFPLNNTCLFLGCCYFCYPFIIALVILIII